MEQRLGQEELGEAVHSSFLEFLESYTEEGRRVYHEQAQELVLNERTTLIVDQRHLSSHSAELHQLVVSSFQRFEEQLERGVNRFVSRYYSEYTAEHVLHIGFSATDFVEKIRSLTSEKIGRLVSISGTVTKSTEVRPELRFGTFRCLACNYEVRDVAQEFKYTTPQVCPNGHCGNKTQWELSIERSRFCDWQKLRVQEHSADIPAGAMPRSIDTVLRHEFVDHAKPGERLVFTGTLVAVPEVSAFLSPGERKEVSLQHEGRRAKDKSLDAVAGLRALGVRELNYKLLFLACGVSKFTSFNYRDEDEEIPLTAADRERIEHMRAEPDLYARLAQSIAPTVFGHEEVKKGILLMLLGGVHKTTPEGMKLRGDINICIVGDPSVAKSQFLKYVCAFLPRAVYTSGKASTAAGLTAAVQRDIETGDFCIEAGALMLADNGICCIDEFDKMDAKDQVAIHEAMEQQTISIAKAGIQATLNARCSVLAAANPKHGRYDRAQELRKNVDMSPPLMSRFDLFFVIVDEGDDYVDYAIAQHIVQLHTRGDQALQPEFSMEELQKYILAARHLDPKISREAAELLREQYKLLRQADALHERNAYRITVRQLESCIRLSEALARLNFDEYVRPEYVLEACRLLKKSIIHVKREDVDLLEEGVEAQFTQYRTQQLRADQARREELEKQGPKKTTISFEEYERIAKWIALFLKENEETGVKQQDILDRYVEQHIHLIQGDADLEQALDVVNGVIQRLITRDHILIVVEDNEERAQRVLKVHWNYVP